MRRSEPPLRARAALQVRATLSAPDGGPRADRSSDVSTLSVVHVALDGEHWQAYGPGAGGVGWDGALMGLAEHLRTGEPADPRLAN